MYHRGTLVTSLGKSRKAAETESDEDTKSGSEEDYNEGGADDIIGKGNPKIPIKHWRADIFSDAEDGSELERRKAPEVLVEMMSKFFKGGEIP